MRALASALRYRRSAHRIRRRRKFSDRPAIRHHPNNAAWADHFHQLQRAHSQQPSLPSAAYFHTTKRGQHTFSCQLRKTLIPPSPPPKLLPLACVNPPVACGVRFLPPDPALPLGCAAVWLPWPIPLYKYFISVSQSSEPLSDLYMRCSKGDISVWRI